MIHLALSNLAEVNLCFRHYKCCINYCKIQVTSRLNFSAPHKQTLKRMRTSTDFTYYYVVSLLVLSPEVYSLAVIRN